MFMCSRMVPVLVGSVMLMGSASFGSTILINENHLSHGQVNSFSSWAGAFDDQPLETSPPPESGGWGNDGIPNGFGQPGRIGYWDFGEDYHLFRIEQIWTLYRQWTSATDHSGVGYKYWWGDAPDTAEAEAVGGPVDLGLLTTAPSEVNDSTWFLEYDGPTITPEGRYLFFETIVVDGSATSGRGAELAIYGEIVPEPGSLALLGAGGLLVFARRRRAAAVR